MHKADREAIRLRARQKRDAPGIVLANLIARNRQPAAHFDQDSITASNVDAAIGPQQRAAIQRI